jgi:hypothetical protein
MKMFKTDLILFILLSVSFNVKSQTDNFDRDFKQVSIVFEKQLEPYLIRFVQNQYPESNNTTEKQLRDQALIDAYVKKAQRFQNELKQTLVKENSQLSKKQIFDAFELGYRMEFPGLDYKFFESVKKSLNI